MNKRQYLINLCKLFKDEQENPYSKSQEFKWYIWKMEKAIIERAFIQDVISEYHLNTDDDYEEFFKVQIKAAIDMYADTPYGGSPDQKYKEYFSL